MNRIFNISVPVVLVLAFPALAAAQTKMIIPTSVKTEHQEIHAQLVAATKAPGGIGIAARKLAAVLDPHFAREEQIALPQLGILEPMAAGEPLPDSLLSEALAMSDTLKKEMPKMLAEHKQIRAAVEELRIAAQADRSKEYEQFAEKLALHAKTEEEVLYPAAVLVADLVRARRK